MATVEKPIEDRPRILRNSEYPQLAPVAPLIGGKPTYASITDDIASIVIEKPHPPGWWITFTIGFMGVCLLGMSITYLFAVGTGIWGVTVPISWGWAIINLVWWIGIGHAGTLISAILMLLRQDWRNAINRFAEAMTIFAVACAATFPLIHMGRPWAGFFILPYPNTMGLWPQFRSPLAWDVFAISTYGSVSILFWYIGLIPDFATLRDRAKNLWVKRAYGAVALGWRGSAKHWFRYEYASIILAGLCTPLVVSVHSIISFDFSIGIVPGWHTTIFPPYFVAGAIYAGFAMVLTMALPVRKWYGIEHLITTRHLDLMAKVMLTTGMVVGYGYTMEAMFSWYSGSQYERFMMFNRMTGPYWPAYWALLLCNVAVPQLLWIKWFRITPIPLFVICMFINVGMWLERYVIVVTSLTRDFMPSAWGTYHGTFWDIATFVGTLCFFAFCMSLFIRFMPMIAIHEIRVLHHKQTGRAHH
ncbi:MAG: NrfD/PsrC family molybdoenzyme membrane anchor subunit [Candidatus Hydrogenedentota bacterium]